ncbi:hypothetical protein TNCV_1285971 [Trichonephila clavipes]|uniref:Uncharacterized protein n=1 Tax=Trichonephila clavipes TaxID=2585209 RepID=A0A8X6VEW3_TRICX|nr:hypothetical protein TNCV_1285971 [Trichonephila clavipes]
MYDRSADLEGRVACLLQSACLPVPRWNTGSSYYLRKRIANEDFQKDWCSHNLPFSAIYLKTARRNLPERKELDAASLSYNFDFLLNNFSHQSIHIIKSRLA